MKITPRQYQHMSLTFLLMTSTYPWKLLVLIQPNTTQLSTAQLYGGSKSIVFREITMFGYIVPVKCKVQILNGSKAPAKCFGLIIVNIPTTNIIIPLWSSYYIPQKPQYIICQTLLKH